MRKQWRVMTTGKIHQKGKWVNSELNICIVSFLIPIDGILKEKDTPLFPFFEELSG